MTGRVIIIGAGIGGLATANLLAKAGYDVHVYEKSTRPGGRAGTLKEKGFTFDTGPSWYLMPEVFEQYFSLFGVSAETSLSLQKLTPAYKVFFENERPIVVSGNMAVDAATFEAIEPGSGKRLEAYVKKSEELYDLSLKHFLYTNFLSFKDFFKKDIITRSIAMVKLALTPIDNYAARYVQDRRLRQILEYPMVFLGSSPFSAPAIYSLMSALDFQRGVFYPKGGLYTVIELLVSIGKEVGVTYHYNSGVASIAVEDGVARGVELANGLVEQADIVISNADLHHTEMTLLHGKYRSYPKSYWDKRQAGPSALLMYIGVRGRLAELEHHNLFFVDAWKENFSNIFVEKKIAASASIYICKPSASDSSVAPDGHENLFVLVPLPAGISLDKTALEDAADMYLSTIENKVTGPIREKIIYKKIFGPNEFADAYNAWQGTALGPSHILRQSAIFRTSNKSKKVENLYYVGGGTIPGIGLPMCLIGAQLTYKRVIGDRTSGPVANIKNEVEL